MSGTEYAFQFDEFRVGFQYSSNVCTSDGSNTVTLDLVQFQFSTSKSRDLAVEIAPDCSTDVKDEREGKLSLIEVKKKRNFSRAKRKEC